MASAMERYEANILRDSVDRDFLEAYRRTLRAALDRIDDRGRRAGLAEAEYNDTITVPGTFRARSP